MVGGVHEIMDGHVKAQPTVSIVISTWRRRTALRKLLFSIARQQNVPPLEVLVADSQSDDGSAYTIDAFCRRVFQVRLIHTINSLAAKRNAGARAANADLLLFLDDDLLLDDRSCLGDIIRESAVEKAPVCFQVEYPKKWCVRSAYYRYKQLGHDITNVGSRELATFRFVAMAFCIRRDLYWSLDGFSEIFRGYGGEDHAFELALRRIGIVPLLSVNARILHCEDSRSFSIYRTKLVGSSSGAMPALLRDWPEAKEQLAIRWLESPLVRRLVKITPLVLLQSLSVNTASLMDLLPRSTPDVWLRCAGRVFAASAYLVGMKLRSDV